MSDATDHCWRSDHELWREVQKAREAADRKHGENSIEQIGASDSRWLSILIEEVGEVAHEQTYDAAGTVEALRAELIDVLSVASAWVSAIDAERRRAEKDTEPQEQVKTYWEGLERPAVRGTAVVADCDFPRYWAREEKLIGERIEVVRLNPSVDGCIDNRYGYGWTKVTEAKGYHGIGHQTVWIEPGSFRERGAAAVSE
ncbi:hypothetical protein [Rhodococcus sp. 06-235-1A]|uniref:hypothetical protein n=1 Tax=Rhodococcus sp. 06-235-1A TaxID=2022508 RepID=UPI00117AB4AD|nr:hypothetical protein [Rhodococcus sp. 06-235-1A]